MAEVYFSETGELPITEGYDDPSLDRLREAADAATALEPLERDINDYRCKMLLYGAADQLLAEGYDEDEHVLFYLMPGDDPLPFDGFTIGERLDRLEADIPLVADDIWTGTEEFVDEPGDVDDRVQDIYHTTLSTFSGDAAADEQIRELREEDRDGYRALSRLADRHRAPVQVGAGEYMPATTVLDRTMAQTGGTNTPLLTAIPAVTAMEGVPTYIEEVATCTVQAEEGVLQEELEQYLDGYREEYRAERADADRDFLSDTLDASRDAIAEADEEELHRLAVRTTEWALEMEELGRAIAAVAVDRRDLRMDEREEPGPQLFGMLVQQELEGERPGGDRMYG